MNKKNPLKNILIVFGLVIVVSLGYWAFDKNQPGDLDTFVQCLEQKGAKFYGAFWCPHCQSQKALFGKSKDLLPYVECSTPDSKGQTQICIDKKIMSYPTWSVQVSTTTGTTTSMIEEFLPGEKTLQELSEKTGCEISTGN